MSTREAGVADELESVPPRGPSRCDGARGEGSARSTGGRPGPSVLEAFAGATELNNSHHDRVQVIVALLLVGRMGHLLGGTLTLGLKGNVMRRRPTTQAHATETNGFDAIPVRYLGLFEYGPKPTPYRPKTAEELVEEVGAAILAVSDAEGTVEPDSSN